jgi:transposase
VQGFDLKLDELHNDSTTVRFCGQYRQARARKLRGKRAPFITYGYSKDHRPDLKQLLFILTTSDDGGVPVQFRCAHGNTNDARTHEHTWEALCRAADRVDFLYIADSKLCNREPMDYIHRRGRRFVCVMPRSHREDSEFREWLQTHEPTWTPVWDRPNPRQRGGPRDRWWVFRYPLPSSEGWPVIWVYSALLAIRQERGRRERLAQAHQALHTLNMQLTGPRPRRRSRQEVQHRLEAILPKHKVVSYVNVELVEDQAHHFRQAKPARPGPHTRYVRKTRTFWRVQWHIEERAIDYDRKSDGMYPLLTNDCKLTDTQLLEAHKRQPTIEKRFEQTKSLFEIAPVLLKNEGRVEALFFVYFLALLVQALIERELRRAMQRQGVDSLPLYPEERTTQRPTAEQIFRLFRLMQRHLLKYKGETVHTFEPELTDLQRQVLTLLGVPETVYRTVT